MKNNPINRDLLLSLEAVKGSVLDSLRETSLKPLVDELQVSVCGGKMLRSRLMFRVGVAAGLEQESCVKAAAAVEMMHAASLLHDDVIDNAHIRRGIETFWVNKGTSGAILLGDLLVCKAISVISSLKNGELVSPLVEMAGEMCDAEAEQELILKGEHPDWDTCVNLARRKTGSLFAFAAYVCGSGDGKLRSALQESGYLVGTAYQLADDLLDAYGNEVAAGKTLGNDRKSAKITAGTSWQESDVDPARCINELLDASVSALSSWPEVSSAWGIFVKEDMRPGIDKLLEGFLVEAAS